MDDVRSGFDSWLCPFCGMLATRETKERILCDSRTCECGAIVLAVPVVDTDEIVDDGLGIFGVQIREESRGFDDLMLEDLHRAGVEIREGQRVCVIEGFWGEYTSLWFRRLAPSAQQADAADRLGRPLIRIALGTQRTETHD